MYSCAYDLNLDIAELKSDLIEMNNILLAMAPEDRPRTINSLPRKQRVENSHAPNENYSTGMYVDQELFQEFGFDSVANLNDFFNDSLITKVRIVNYHPGETYIYHRDGQCGREGYFGEDMKKDNFMITPTILNVLLSEPQGDTTVFGRSTNLRKCYQRFISTPEGKKSTPVPLEEDVVEVDRFTMTDKATLMNVGSMHKVETGIDNPRILVSFVFWPSITWQEVIEFCRDRGVLIERACYDLCL